MELVAPIVDKVKAFAKYGGDFIRDLSCRPEKKARSNPIEILKRLQREAFTDLMKLRDRQERVERMLTSYKISKGGPFQEDGTRVRGEVDVMGILLLMDYLEQQNVDAIKRAGIRTGIDARITFETKIRRKDILEAEFISSQSNHRDCGDILGSTLSLAKVCYTANINDWLSMVAVPMGARCRDVATPANSSFQEKGLTDNSSFVPPLLHGNHGGAIGLTVKKSNIVASLAQFVVDLPGSFGHCLSTFGHIVYHLPRSSKLSLFGLHQVSKSTHHVNLGPLTIPLGILRSHGRPDETLNDPSSPRLGTNIDEITPTGSVAVMLESELDESTRVGGWVQLKNINPRNLQWAICISDFPEDQIGWGLSLGGMTQGQTNLDHFQVEAFLKFKLGKRLTFQPAFVYLMNGNNQMPALMFRSTWSL